MTHNSVSRNLDPITCAKADLRDATAGMPASEKRAIYKARWRHRNPGVTEQASKDWAKRNPTKRQNYRDKYAQERKDSARIPYHTEWARANRQKAMLSSARYRAKKKGIAFAIDASDVTIPECCPVFGFRLETSGSVGRSDASPSLDRINNSLGYIKGNVIVVSWLANRLKNDATSEQLRTVADFYEAQAQKISSASL